MSPITSAGVRKKWISGGDIMTPLYDYEQQTDGYADWGYRRGSYCRMWDNYLSKLDIIKKYLASKQ